MHQGEQRRARADVLATKTVLQARGAALIGRDHPELHGLWPLRPPRCGSGEVVRRPVSVLPRHYRRDWTAQQAALFPSAGAQIRYYQEQLVHAVRHRHAGHYQPFEDSAAAGCVCRVYRRDSFIRDCDGVSHLQVAVLAQFLGGYRTGGDWHLLSQFDRAGILGNHRRICRRDSYSGAEAALCD